MSPKQVLGHEHVEPPGPSHQLHRGGVDVEVVGLDVRELGGHLVEDLAEEGERAEDVRLVDAGDARSRAAPTLGQLGRPRGRPARSRAG